jgi:tRNA(Ile)-lysidine synthase
LPGSEAALAVSGGGDSVALVHLFTGWAKRQNCATPVVLIVDHALRDESGEEAARAAQWARSAGLEAHILRRQGAKPKSNIEDEARKARYRLLGAWCASHAVTKLFVAHTREDQAETFLLRLGRGSGLDGLSGMRAIAPLPVAGFADVQILRPLLDMGRAELRLYLKEQGASWLEDPMNEDSRFARVRIRKALPELEAAGIPTQRIAEAARHLGRARESLDAATQEFLGRYARFECDFALIDGAALAEADREIGLRALAAALMRHAKVSYRPRFERLEGLFDAIRSGDFAGRTLEGCRIGKAPKARALFGPATLLIAREGSRRVSMRKNVPNGSAEKFLKGHPAEISQVPPHKGRIRPF